MKVCFEASVIGMFTAKLGGESSTHDQGRSKPFSTSLNMTEDVDHIQLRLVFHGLVWYTLLRILITRHLCSGSSIISYIGNARIYSHTICQHDYSF